MKEHKRRKRLSLRYNFNHFCHVERSRNICFPNGYILRKRSGWRKQRLL